MLQGIRPSTLTMPPFGQELSLGGVSKVEAYGDSSSWSWPQSAPNPSYSSMFDPSMYASFAPHLQPPSRTPSRHHSIATSHVLHPGTATPPPSRSHVAANMVKAQPAFKPTWQGFLDTTKDAMTVVEAALQGRLHHISRRPHDKERAEMLTSGTVLVYEENASGIKRWTDAVHWSPSRVMNNCLIYRQLVRALKPEEKKTALNPSCGTKRKRKESSGPTITKTGDNVTNSDDEYENPAFDPLAGDVDSTGKVYANFAQSLSPDQQRRFCGSLIDSYEFKEGGLMKKTISVKYQGTHHHVISYYSLEDVVSGKLKRPFQDPRLASVQPRPELLTGWKVSLEDEESKDMPLVAGYPQHLQPSHLQQHIAVSQGVGVHGGVQTHAPLLHVPDYWHPSHVQQYQSPSHSTYQYQSQSAQQYVQPQSPQAYSPHTTAPQYPPQPAPAQHYTTTHHTQPRHYSFDQMAAPQYAASHHPQPTPTPPPQYTVPSAPTFDMHVSVPQHSTPTPVAVQQHDQQRRASAPVALQPYSGYPAPPPSYYVEDHKYAPGSHRY
jgi:hypothetical protein